MSATDGFVHRPGVLRGGGWDVLQVDGATWCRRPEAVVREVIERVRAENAKRVKNLAT